KGIILQSGEISKDKISLITGAITAPLIEMDWISSGYDAKTIERISTTLTHLYKKNQQIEMMSVLRILYDVLGLQFPEDVELLADHPEARQYFLFSFLIDMGDCIHNFMDEFVVERNEI
ncbi:MAG: hypothetical protein ACOX7R_01670, partial [Acetivibrionales bacterium]